jgi:hypothetical protein
MDALDKRELKGHYIVINNEHIHNFVSMRELIEEMGYKCAHFLIFSTFHNLIEELRLKVKHGIKRRPLDGSDILIPQIVEACFQTTLSGRRGWITHYASFIECPGFPK